MSDGRVVVVTGGTRGIGLGLAGELVERGCRVVVCGRSSAAVDSALAALGERSDALDRVSGLAADVTDREALQAVWDHAVATLGRVDVWINNAGISAPRLPLTEVPAQVAESVVRTNLVGAINGCAVALAGLATQSGGGWIWNMEGFGSNGQLQPGMSIYGASKRGVSYLTSALVKEAKGTDVRIGFLSPGIVATDLLVADYEGQPEAFERARKIFNILGDRVETVTPWLADRLLAARKNGTKVAWLTSRKAMGRFMTAGFRKRDIFPTDGSDAAHDVTGEKSGGVMATIDPCVEYGMALAIEDFVPVVLAGAGLIVLAQALAKAVPQVRAGACFGAIVVTLGGLGKAVWKLLVAGPCIEIPFLEQMLFPCLAVGFSALAWALVSVWVGKVVAWVPFALVPFVGACISGAARNLTPMLAIAALAAVAVGGIASALARRHGDRIGQWLFFIYIVGTLVLPPLAARPHQTELLQWGEQLTNTLVQLSFLIGALRLTRRIESSAPASRTEGASVS